MNNFINSPLFLLDIVSIVKVFRIMMRSTETNKREYKAARQHYDEPRFQYGDYGHLTKQRQYSWNDEYQKIGNIVITLGRSKIQMQHNIYRIIIYYVKSRFPIFMRIAYLIPNCTGRINGYIIGVRYGNKRTVNGLSLVGYQWINGNSKAISKSWTVFV